MSEALHVDFETRSAVELKTAGLDVYANDPTTDALCLAAALNDDPVWLWTPEPTVLPTWFTRHIEGGGIVTAHNAQFEFAIWNAIMAPRYGWPMLKLEQMRCTMAMAYAMSLPGALDDLALALGLEYRKDHAGRRIMLKLCKPRKINADGSIVWWDDPEDYEKLYAYCKQDVVVEREAGKRLLPLSESEQKLWVLDQRINQRGIAVDRQATAAAMKMADAEKRRLDKKVEKLTGGFVGTCNSGAAMVQWIEAQGVKVDSVAKAEVTELLTRPDLPAVVREVLLSRQEAAKSSTAKLKPMLGSASADGRVRCILQYHAASTGRWGGRRIQPQNFPRPAIEQDDIEHAVELILKGERDSIEMIHGRPLDVISWCLRGLLIAGPGRDLIAGDFANIEGRMLAWLAGEEWKLQAFREYDAGIGPDLYKVAYAASFGIKPEDVTKPERQIGKVEELMLGYEGGVGAFLTGAKSVNLDIAKMADAAWPTLPAWALAAAQDAWEWAVKRKRTYDLTQKQYMACDAIKRLWRSRHPETVSYWSALQGNAIAAVRAPGIKFKAGAQGREVTYLCANSFLFCRLPSGRVLAYPYPRVVEGDDGKSKLQYMGENSLTKQWEWTGTYGGKLAENVTQAASRDVLAEALLRLDERGAQTVLHVHDEVVVEIPESSPLTPEQFEQILSESPAWAGGLPIAAEAWRGKRYRK